MCAKQSKHRGILTEDDAKFLRGDDVPSSASQRSRARQRIRKRVEAAMYDFEILLNHWPDDQQRKTLDSIDKNSKEPIEDIGSNMIAFFYHFVNSGNTHPDIVLDDDPVEKLLRFRSSLTRGVKKGSESFDNSPGIVSVAPTTPLYETPDTDSVRQEIDSEALTDVHRKLNQKYRGSSLYEDDEVIINNRNSAIVDLFLEWDERVTSAVIEKRLKSDEFIRGLNTLNTNVQGYRDEFNEGRDPGSES